LVSKEKQDTLETLEFFFEDDIMLKRFMEYFDGFTLEVDYSLYKKVKVQQLVLDGIPDLEIAKKVDLPYKAVWRIRDRFIKSRLYNYMKENR